MRCSRTSVEKLYILHCAVLIAALVALGVPVGGQAVEIQPGRIYPGDTRVEVSAYGMAFSVPAGWQGALPAGSEVFVLKPDLDPEVSILAMGDKATRAEVIATMSAPIALGSGLSLHPTAAVTERGEVLTCRYEVRGAPSPLSAYTEAVTGSNGISVAYVLIAAPAALTAHESAVQALVAGTDLGTSAVPPAGKSNGSAGAGGATSSTEDRWDAYLKGKHIVRYYTTTSYTEEHHLWLCSDGSFSRRGNTGGFGGGASGAFEGKAIGRWTASGAGEHGRLTLHFGDRSTTDYDLRWDFGKNELYVDGKRWLHDKNKVCN